MYGDELGLNSEEESELMLPPSVNDISSILECDSLSIQVEQAEVYFFFFFYFCSLCCSLFGSFRSFEGFG